MMIEQRPDKILEMAYDWLLEHLDDLKAVDGASDLSWLALHLANRIDGGNRNSV